MKNCFINVFLFAAGAAIGSAVTWKFIKTKYERIANEEIEAAIKHYSKDDKNDSIEEETPREVDEYINEVEKNGYTAYSDKEEKKEKKKGGKTVMTKDGPYVIAPEEFDELPGYDAVTLTYYNDGVVTNMFDSPLDEDEIEELIGRDSLTHFGEYEADSVFVRNDELRADYEILLDLRNYSDVVSDSRQVDE